jgi:hypothetical protein
MTASVAVTFARRLPLACSVVIVPRPPLRLRQAYGSRSGRRVGEVTHRPGRWRNVRRVCDAAPAAAIPWTVRCNVRRPAGSSRSVRQPHASRRHGRESGRSGPDRDGRAVRRSWRAVHPERVWVASNSCTGRSPFGVVARRWGAGPSAAASPFVCGGRIASRPEARRLHAFASPR